MVTAHKAVAPLYPTRFHVPDADHRAMAASDVHDNGHGERTARMQIGGQLPAIDARVLVASTLIRAIIGLLIK